MRHTPVPNRLGRTAADLTNSSGNTLATHQYRVFRAIRTQAGSSPNYWVFTGEQRDADSSLYYLRARYYDPFLGRFLSQDPAKADHPYVYVGNNPTGDGYSTGKLPARTGALFPAD